MKFLHQISQKLYFRPKTSFYPDRGDIEPNEPWRAYVPMGLYQTPVSNRKSIFFTCSTIGCPSRFSQKPCLNGACYIVEMVEMAVTRASAVNATVQESRNKKRKN